MSKMEKSDLISYYKRPYFIFNGTSKTIEDDEILDLDSISLDSNEDTWLWSNSKSSTETNSNYYKDIDSIDFERIENEITNENIADQTDFSRLSLTDWDFKEATVSESFMDFKKVSYSQKSESCMSENKLPWTRLVEKNQNSPMKIDIGDDHKDITSSNERYSFSSKKPALKRDNIDKSNILFSIENKLFSLTDTDAIDLKTIPSREIKSADKEGIRRPVEGIMHEKNYSEIKGTEKRKSLLNEQPHPVYHSTPMLYKRHMNKVETENDAHPVSLHESNELVENQSISPNTTFTLSVNSSNAKLKTSDTEISPNSVHSKSNGSLSPRPADEEGLNSTYDVDETLLTPSSGSRKSSTSSNNSLKTAFQGRQLVRQSYGVPKMERRPASATELTGTRTVSKIGTIKKVSPPESKMKLPSRRAPSLTRLPAPTLNIDEEFVSVVEIKSKDGLASRHSASSTIISGPSSHIPRPSTRIPVFRNSVSCSRTTSRK